MELKLHRALVSIPVSLLLTCASIRIGRSIHHILTSSSPSSQQQLQGQQFRNVMHNARFGSHISMHQMLELSIHDFTQFCDLVLLLLETTPTAASTATLVDGNQSGGEVVDSGQSALVDCVCLVKQCWQQLRDREELGAESGGVGMMRGGNSIGLSRIAKFLFGDSEDNTNRTLGTLWRDRKMQTRRCEFALGCLLYMIKLEHNMSTNDEDLDYLLFQLENGVSEREHPTVKYLWQLQYDTLVMTNPKSQFTDADDIKHVFAKLNRFVTELHDGYKRLSTSASSTTATSMDDGTLIYFRGLTRQEVIDYGLVFIVEQLLYMFFILGSSMEFKQPAELCYISSFLLEKCVFLSERMRVFLSCMNAESMHNDLNGAVLAVDRILQRYPEHHRALILRIDLLNDLLKFKTSEEEEEAVKTMDDDKRYQHHHNSLATMRREELESELCKTIKRASRARVPHNKLTNSIFVTLFRKHSHEPSVLLAGIEEYFHQTHPQPPLTEMHFVEHIKRQCELSSQGNLTFVYDHYMHLLEKFRHDITLEHRFAQTLLDSKLIFYFTEKTNLLFSMGHFDQCAQVLDGYLQHVSSKTVRFSTRDVSRVDIRDNWISDLKRLCHVCSKRLDISSNHFHTLISRHLSVSALPFNLDIVPKEELQSVSIESEEIWGDFLDIVWTLFAQWKDDPFMLAFDIRRFKKLVLERAPQLPDTPTATNAYGLVLLYRYFKKPSSAHRAPSGDGSGTADMEEKEVRRVEKMQRVLVGMDLRDAINLLETGSLSVKKEEQHDDDNDRTEGDSHNDLVTDLMMEMQREFEMDLESDRDELTG